MRHFPALLASAIALGLLLPGCGSRSGSPQLNQAPVNTETAPAVPDTGMQERNILSASLPDLSVLAPGAEFDFTLRLNAVQELFQGTGRVLYNPEVVQPISAINGSLVPAGAVFVAKLEGALADGSNDKLSRCVPYAFTALPGQAPTQPGQGELLRLRFRLTGRLGGGTPVRLLNDPAYLQLRDAQGRRLSFDLAEEVGTK